MRLHGIQTILTTVQSRSGHNIVRESLINVDQDTLILLSIQLYTKSSLRISTTTTSNLQIQALRVILRTILLTSRVQRDNLVTHHVVSSRDRVRNSHRPAVSGIDQLIRSPGSGNIAIIDKADGVDLEEFQLGLVDGAAVSVAGCEVCDDGAVVRLWPLSPLDVDVGTGLDFGGECGVLAIAVADDVWVGILGAVFKAEIGGGGGPADAVWGAIHVGVLIDDVASVARRGLAIVHDCYKHITGVREDL